MSNKKNVFSAKKIAIFILYAVFFTLIWQFFAKTVLVENTEENKGGLEKAEENYKEIIDSLAQKFDLSSSYLLAVIMLESSGRKKVPSRYEHSIYLQLKDLQNNKIDQFENIIPNDLKNKTDNDLKKMASSWGPFQLMGYKCFFLNISLYEMKDNITYWSIKWINLTYGDYVRKGEFKHAFHIHNAGKKYPETGIPTTYDPNYVVNGLNFIQYFSELSINDKKNNTVISN